MSRQKVLHWYKKYWQQFTPGSPRDRGRRNRKIEREPEREDGGKTECHSYLHAKFLVQSEISFFDICSSFIHKIQINEPVSNHKSRPQNVVDPLMKHGCCCQQPKAWSREITFTMCGLWDSTTDNIANQQLCYRLEQLCKLTAQTIKYDVCSNVTLILWVRRQTRFEKGGNSIVSSCILWVT